MKRLWLRQFLIAALILGYAVLAHYSNAAGSAGLGAALAVAPALLVLVLLISRTPRAVLTLPLALLVIGALLLRYWSLLEHNFPLMYELQECGTYLMLAAAFGRSLMRGQVPLCTHWADTLHGPLSAQARRYTAAATAAWTVFFVAISAASALLYRLAPLRVWSLFSNFLTLPLVVLMFLGEYALRRRLLPSMNRYTLADTVRAYLAAKRAGSAPRV